MCFFCLPVADTYFIKQYGQKGYGFFMKIWKKLAVITAAVVVSANSAAFAAFSDMPDGEIGNALNNAVENGLITGYEDGTVRPNDNITRAQMATIITRAFGAIEEAQISFPDVASDEWYRDEVAKAVAMGVFKGDENGNFNPENNITFQETYTVVARAFYLEPLQRGEELLHAVSDTALDSFSDKNSVADWAQIYAKSVVENGGWKGVDGMLKGTDYITRGEFALLMDEIVTTYIDAPGTYEGLGDGLVMVRSGGVKLSGLETTKNVIVCYNVDKKGCTIEKSNVSGAVICLGGANPTQYIDKDGNTYTTANDDPTISIGGTFVDVRVLAPYISLDARDANLSIRLRGVKDSLIYPPTKN